MSPIKSIAVFMVILGLLLPTLSFTSGDLLPAELSLEKSIFEVTPDSIVVVNFEFYETFPTRDYTIRIEGNGIDVSTPKINLDYKEIYHGSLSFNAPTTPGTYTYKTHTYMYTPTQVEFGYDVKTITVTVIDLVPSTYTLTVNVQDENEQALSGAEVLINTGVIGTTGTTGIVTKSDLIGSYTVTATKPDYNSDSTSANMIQDQTVTLTLEKSTIEPIENPDLTPTPTPDVISTPTPNAIDIPDDEVDDVAVPSVTPSPTPITYNFIVEILDTSDPQQPISNAKVSINGNDYFTNFFGMKSISVNPGEQLNVVITKDGYNTFEKSYTVQQDTKVKITLPESGGEFFLNLNLASKNPFYDPEGLFEAIPNIIAVMSILFVSVGIVLFRREYE